MDKITEYQQESVKSVQMANYLLSTSYKLVKEPKALLSITDHVLSSFLSSVSALLLFERTKKEILPYHENDESKMNAFRKLVPKYDLQNYMATIETIINLSQEHKKASVEFSRDNKFIICSEEFKKIETVSETDVKEYIKKAKEFTQVIGRIINE